MRRYGFFPLGVIFLFIVNQASASDNIIFTESFVRGANSPMVEVCEVQGAVGPGLMLVTNVGVEDDNYEIVSSITVVLNDQEIFSGQNFDPSLSVLQEQIDLLDGSNTLSVVVKGKPNGRIDIQIIQDVGKFPDTGQTTSYTDTYGEDSDYIINPLFYTDNGDGTVTDNNTGLMWQQEDDDFLYNWYQASGTAGIGEVDVCGDLELADYDDWRLPTEKELQLIVNYGIFDPAIDQTFFSGPIVWNYWSSTPLVGPSSPLYAWYVNFNIGIVSHDQKTSSYYVRCVRGGQ